MFSVRGTNTSPLASLGLTALPGANVQSGDAYIVADYIRSKQVFTDAIQLEGIDLRSFFSYDNIDPVFRISHDMPFDEFVSYWNWMSAVEFNSTTGITTFRVNAFEGKDAKKISEVVLKVSERLVNRLASTAREQLINTAKEEVDRTERRLFVARQSVEVFRNREQALDPQLRAQSEETIIRELQSSLAELQARRSALNATLADSPTLRVIERQILALEQQIQHQRQRVGSGSAETNNNDGQRSLSQIYTDYNALLHEQEFSEKAYTSALTALEQALSEARKQERYFAIVLEPTEPEIAMYPTSITNTLLAAFGLCVIWLLGYLVIQSIRDHAI